MSPPRTKEARDRYHAARRARQRALIEEARAVPCERCGGDFPSYVMEFHHRDPRTKLFNISQGDKVTEVRLLEELAKCDVLCANCHRIADHELEET